MGKKSEERARRELENQAKFEKSKEKILARMDLRQDPKIAVDTGFVSEPRVADGIAPAPNTPKTSAVVPAVATPKAPTASTFSRHKSRMTWCKTKADGNGDWTWGEPRAWTSQEWNEKIHPGMEELSPLTWREIESLNSGSGHRMHHEQDLGDIAPEAIARWHEIGLGEFDALFRFRIGGQKSHAWGYILQAHFFFVWWERLHKIYPTVQKKKARQQRRKDKKKRDNQKRLDNKAKGKQ